MQEMVFSVHPGIQATISSSLVHFSDSMEPEEPARPPPGEHPTTSLDPTKPLPDEELRQRRLLHLGE